MSEIRPHYKDFNEWEPIDEDEIDRLQKTLHPHLKKINNKISLIVGLDIIMNTMGTYRCRQEEFI